MRLFCKIVAASVFERTANRKCVFEVFASDHNAVMSHKASGCVADCRGNVFHESVRTGKCRFCARNLFAQNVLIFSGTGIALPIAARIQP